jgi:flagellar biosynthesis protein FlhF
VFLFVGPTGVGKTTTLAKLAAKLSLIDNKKVGLITADTYRIAAVDQLKTYSEILGIPLSVVYEASELPDVMYKYKDKDVILLDTAGRSHKSEELSRDLQDLMNNLENPEIFLVISLTTGYKDIVSIIDAYNFVDEYKIIFTKLDEASSYGNILNVKVESGKALSYLTTGQSVPDDIEIADSEKIVNYIVGDANDRSSI